MHTNRLANESSPYLLEHAHNPVDWYPWGPEAFAKARSEDKPIFLSVGYSTCHWCHVMERESFEDERIAAILNRAFVAIKVDREERPDIDRVYMTFVQATTGSGGWPMSVWLTPELRPFFGGTYFPPDGRAGHAGFTTVLERIAEAWREEHDKIVESSIDVVEQLRKHIELPPSSAAGRLDQTALASGFQVFRRGYDARHGGFGGAPKFPQPSIFNFLLRYHARTASAEARDMVLATLDALAAGGIHDQLGGGFHRYAVDEAWRVPHFEKMLYDQAQLAVSFVEAFQISGNPEYAATARRTLDYVLRDMRDPEGGFYSAEDADSVIDPSQPETKGEGAYYLWTPAQVREISGEPACDWFAWRYGVEEGGNAAEADPHGEFTGKSILYRAHSIEETARRFERPVAEVRAGIAEAERKLLEARAARVRPHLDDKVLAGWNGLMITALARAGAALAEPVYTEAAARAAGFIAARMYDPAGGVLLRRYRKGDAAIPGFLDDYAFLTQGLLDLYEAGFELRWLRLAVALAEKQRELFEDPGYGGFFSAPPNPDLVIRAKEDYDGAEPSGNSIAILNLLRLARMLDRADFRQSAEKALETFANRILSMPAGLPQMLAACEFYLGQPREIVVAGEPASADTRELLRMVHSRFLPSKVLLLASGEEGRRELAAYQPAVALMGPRNGRATAYVCRNYACELPTADPSKLAELLQ
jgi:uncharacterized protein YyaL (SSP411 family)